MEVNANYVENVSGNAIKMLRKMLFDYVKNSKSMSNVDVKNFVTYFCQIEEVLTESLSDAIAYRLCKGERVFGSLDRSKKNEEKGNIYDLAFENFPKLAKAKIFVEFSKNHDIRINGDINSIAVKKIAGSKIEQRVRISNPTFAKQEENVEYSL